MAPAGRTLVLVTGSTRSGTSLMAGILDGLGLHVPRPVIVAKPTNPLGFFESKWSVRFHKRILARRFVNQTDGRPDAFDLVAEAVTDDDRARLRSWLERSFRETDRVVVKDPRIIWTAPLWASAAAEVGLGVGFVVMIRATFMTSVLLKAADQRLAIDIVDNANRSLKSSGSCNCNLRSAPGEIASATVSMTHFTWKTAFGRSLPSRSATLL